MAKKEPTIADAVDIFFNIIDRCGFSVFKREDKILHTKNKKNAGTYFIIDQTLWNAVSEDQDFNEIVRELSPLIPADRLIIDRIPLLRDMENGWIEISDESMMNDPKIYISLEGYNYQIEVNKTIWPIRFKKAENNNFAYKIFRGKTDSFAIRKKFVGPLDDTSFYMVRMFQII